MAENEVQNNVVNICGVIISDAEYSHEVYGEGFYYFFLEVARLSNNFDRIQITVSERLLGGCKFEIGAMVQITGQFRSYNNYGNEGSKLILTVFAREIDFVLSNEQIKNPNQIFLDGYICKKPVYRITPFGREIADILLAVNRLYNKSDYIPCIAWGRNAKYADSLKVGDNVKIWGRIQSREYQKKMNTCEVITKTAFEVSISKMNMNMNMNENIASSLEN